MDEVDRIRLRLAQKLAGAVEIAPTLVILHANTERQDEYADRSLPASAARLLALADGRGWAVRAGWSKVAIPHGYRQSNHHKREPVGRVAEYVGVYLAAYGVRAWSTWEVTRAATGKYGSAHMMAYLTSKYGNSGPIGFGALMTYILGESEESVPDSASLDNAAPRDALRAELPT